MANPFAQPAAKTAQPVRRTVRTHLEFDTTTARPENRIINTLSTYTGGGADAPAQKSDRLATLRLRDDVRTAAHRYALSPETASLLNSVAESYAATKEPASFHRADAARSLGLSLEQVDAVMHSLTSKGLLTPRSNAMGSHAGYVPTLR
jgi:hypothetical protein